MRMPWTHYQDRLVEFLESLISLPKDYSDITDIRNEAEIIADTYGRLHPEKFRPVWKKLSKGTE